MHCYDLACCPDVSIMQLQCSGAEIIMIAVNSLINAPSAKASLQSVRKKLLGRCVYWRIYGNCVNQHNNPIVQAVGAESEASLAPWPSSRLFLIFLPTKVWILEKIVCQ